MPSKPLVIANYDPTWPDRFLGIAQLLRRGPAAKALRIDHVGSTAVAGLPAKDVIDIQITVDDLRATDRWPDELLPGLVRRVDIVMDHEQAGAQPDPLGWNKRYWADPYKLHVHIREDGRPNQRYALLFRDYLRADGNAACAYHAVKRALAAAAPDNWQDWHLYYEVKDAACDLIMAGAEQWATRVEWNPPRSDA